MKLWTTSADELAGIAPVCPPTEKRRMKQKAQRLEGVIGSDIRW